MRRKRSGMILLILAFILTAGSAAAAVCFTWGEIRAQKGCGNVCRLSSAVNGGGAAEQEQ